MIKGKEILNMRTMCSVNLKAAIASTLDTTFTLAYHVENHPPNFSQPDVWWNTRVTHYTSYLATYMHSRCYSKFYYNAVTLGGSVRVGRAVSTPLIAPPQGTSYSSLTIAN